MQQVKDLHYVRINHDENDFEEIEFNRNHEHITLIHCISDDTFKLKNIIEMPEGSLTENEFKVIYKNADNQEFISNKEEKIKGQFGITGLLRFPKRNENVPEKYNGIFVHKLMVCPLCSFFAPEYLEYIQFMMYAYDEIKLKALKNEVERLRKEMPQTIQKTHFYLIAYDNEFDEENTDPNDWVTLHAHNPEMGQNENRMKRYKKIFVRVDDLTTNRKFNGKEIKPLLEAKFGPDVRFHDTLIYIRFRLLPNLKEVLIEYFSKIEGCTLQFP